MKRLHVLVLSLLFVVTNVIANEIQVFTSNTMDLKVDKNAKVEVIYQGGFEDFMKDPKASLGDVAIAGANGFVGPNTVSSGLAGAGIGAVSGLAVYAIGSGVEWFISDNQYLVLSKVTNPDGKQTIIESLVVANNYLTDSELAEIGKKELSKIKG